MKYVIALDKGPHWKNGELLLYMGEIENMKGHGVYLKPTTGQIFSGFHIDSFFEYTGTHYGEYCISDFFESTNCVWVLPINLINLLIELNESHIPEAAEKSFVIQAAKIRFG